MSLLYIAGLYALIVQVYGCYFYGIKVLIYLTSWCSILHTFTLIYFIVSKKHSKFSDNLLITSWTLGWAVTILFWCLIYPFVSSSLLPPAPQYISTHGGINLFISYFFIKSKMIVRFNQSYYSFIICLVYLFGMIAPLKYYGIIVYPKFMLEVKATLIYVFGFISLNLISFLAGYLLKREKVKSN